MGVNLLMKILFTFTTLLLSTLIADETLSWVDKQIEAIKPPRVSVSDSKLSLLKDPFIFQKSIQTTQEASCGIFQLTSNKERVEANKFYRELGLNPTHDGYKLYF